MKNIWTLVDSNSLIINTIEENLASSWKKTNSPLRTQEIQSIFTLRSKNFVRDEPSVVCAKFFDLFLKPSETKRKHTEKIMI